MESSGNGTLDRIQREIEEVQIREEELRQNYKSNGHQISSPEPPVVSLTNGRKYAPHTPARGVMQKFIRMRGKLSVVAMKPKLETQTAWTSDTFVPAKLEVGRAPRNGFVSAEEKMKRELVEFQQREAELRLERKKSQPDLMAALELEDPEVPLKPARSLVSLYSADDLSQEDSLKPARSLADLCDASDEELETRRTHSLIRQFERMKSQG